MRLQFRVRHSTTCTRNTSPQRLPCADKWATIVNHRDHMLATIYYSLTCDIYTDAHSGTRLCSAYSLDRKGIRNVGYLKGAWSPQMGVAIKFPRAMRAIYNYIALNPPLQFPRSAPGWCGLSTVNSEPSTTTRANAAAGQGGSARNWRELRVY